MLVKMLDGAKRESLLDKATGAAEETECTSDCSRQNLSSSLQLVHMLPTL